MRKPYGRSRRGGPTIFAPCGSSKLKMTLKNEVSLLETIIREAGHEVIFCPKFHRELNYIEYYWAELKRYTRANCKYSFAELEKNGDESYGFRKLNDNTSICDATQPIRWEDLNEEQLLELEDELLANGALENLENLWEEGLQEIPEV
ncbi:hypothetical protein FN846DRAFT_919271 [Sphaerosporella brunnea]|uniref:Tc1-like transposase DDE domain-containing protein n=1 Tax=Sphaerosporella brunnea TaxID=1250544 RepID=A0A5J5EWV9_9PEZI|nr:hypothetical protein FN846DRAFT_919271 [Sphaerosporella brunnea]